MPFFQGATSVDASHGTFNDVTGDQTFTDNSNHSTATNSNNTTTVDKSFKSTDSSVHHAMGEIASLRDVTFIDAVDQAYLSNLTCPSRNPSIVLQLDQEFPVEFGNTSAIRLTEHLSPERQANILLLACGDPRHILYTAHTNETIPGIEPQKLDITCCDVEPAVLARNAILFTLLADEGALDRLDLIWNIFYHFMLDQSSLSLLVEQCRKLVTLAKDLDSWRAGPYARFLTTCDAQTLVAIRRLWILYAATAEYDPGRRRRFETRFRDGMKSVKDRHGDGFVVTSSRSAGPLFPLAVNPVAEQFRRFWSSGITDDGVHGTERATCVNPTFAFSTATDEFAVHYGVDPVAGFHLAEVFATSRSETDGMLVQKLVRAARDQFSHWCISVVGLLNATSPTLVIRMFAGDALRLCQAFSHLNSHGATATPISSSPWRAAKIELEESQYGEGASARAPTTFDVIDTSNVSDHVGLINLLVVAGPLLSISPCATLYTEALLSYGDTPSADVLERLCGDMQTMSLLLGIVPAAFLSRFTARSNVHETLMQLFHGEQYHERIAWKSVGSDHLTSFTSDQLGSLLFEIYLKMFADENMMRQMQNIYTSTRQALLQATLVHYTRRSFVELLSRLKSRVQADWTRVMLEFDNRVVQDSTLILGSNLYQEMCCHFHLLDIITFTSMEVSYIRDLRAKLECALFEDWEVVPSTVTVVLVVPRSKMTAIESALRAAGTPLLQCEIKNASLWNMFTHLSAAYGRLEVSGMGQMKTATIMEDEPGESTSSPLIVSFSVPSSSLILSPNATVGFRARPSPRMLLVEAIFSAPLEDSRHVHILAEAPFPSTARSARAVKDSRVRADGGSKRVFCVQMNESGTEICSFAYRVDITDPVGQASLAAGASVKLEQMQTRGDRLCIDKYMETIYFPTPVNAANARFRVARKSMYVEVVAPLALSMRAQNERRVAKRFLTILEDGIPTLLNVHRVNLDRCPRFNPSEGPDMSTWLVPHVSLMFSQRERTLRQTHSLSPKDTFVNLKDSLHSLLLSAAGVEGPAQSVFALQNTAVGQRLAIFVVAGLRLDVGSHTVIADAWVVPGTTAVEATLVRIKTSGFVTIEVDADESEAWRHLLPLLVERCRTWTHKPECEYAVQKTVPLYPGAGADPEKNPICGCGVGVGVGTGGKMKRFEKLAPYATRVAIGPMFAVPYLERVGRETEAAGDEGSGSGSGADPERCAACGKRGGPLSVCGRCKRARYCSKACQVGDWKVHKKNCVA